MYLLTLADWENPVKPLFFGPSGLESRCYPPGGGVDISLYFHFSPVHPFVFSPKNKSQPRKIADQSNFSVFILSRLEACCVLTFRSSN